MVLNIITSFIWHCQFDMRIGKIRALTWHFLNFPPKSYFLLYINDNDEDCYNLNPINVIVVFIYLPIKNRGMRLYITIYEISKEKRVFSVL